MMMLSPAFALLVLLGPAVLKADRPEHRIGFEAPAHAAGFRAADWEAYAPAGVRFVDGPERASLDDTLFHAGRHSLRIDYPKGAVGPSQGGHQAAIQLAPAVQYCLSYWLRFSEGFSWGGSEQGGKLPGLAQGRLCSGGDSCNGSNGFTARYMWRENGAAVLYLYHMDKPDRWGEDFALLPGKKPFYFEPGQWTHLEQRVKINSGENPDGEVQVWVNGTEALNLRGLRFVTDGSKVDTFYFSTFHGGNTPGWGPLSDGRVWFDDIRIAPNEDCH